MDWPSDAAKNAALWAQINREHTDDSASTNWALDEIHWGIWAIEESQLQVLGDVGGLDVVELGCGTAYFSAWLAKRGARPVGVDVTPEQLETARRMMAETGIEFPLVEADAAETGLPDASFDLVLSEYGASIWTDPYRWVPEAARLLRRGGNLVFLVNSAVLMLCMPDEDEIRPAVEQLLRPYFGMHRFEWKSDDSVNFNLTHGEWIRVLRTGGFEVERLVEVRAPEGASRATEELARPEWARQWPTEEIWVARKRAAA